MEEISFWNENRTIIYAVCFVGFVVLFYLIFIDPSIISNFIQDQQHAALESHVQSIAGPNPTPKESWLTKPII